MKSPAHFRRKKFMASQARSGVLQHPLARILRKDALKNTHPDFARYLQNALGSASELEYHLLLGKDLGFLASSQYAELDESAKELKRMLTSFITKLRSRAAGA
jgi:hypothetical protein